MKYKSKSEHSKNHPTGTLPHWHIGTLVKIIKYKYS